MTMEDQFLKKLTIYIENKIEDDIVIVFAEPSFKDVEKLISDKLLLKDIKEYLHTDSKGGADGSKENLDNKEEIVANIQGSEKMKKEESRESEKRVKEENGDKVEVVKKEVGVEDGHKVKMEVFEGDKEASHLWPWGDFGHQDILETNIQEKTYPCDFCGKLFGRRDGLLAHKRLHTGGKPFSCEVCDISFAKYSEMKKHRNEQHEQSFACEICNKIFTRKGVLVQHRKIHTGEKPFSCETCGKSFTEKSSLKVHSAIHLVDKPYPCEVCGKRFSVQLLLERHKPMHNKQFPCDTCGKLFSKKGDVTIHSRVHTNIKPYSCETCGKSFSQSQHLEKHKRTHTGEKPFACDVCGKTFSVKWNLNVHKRIHTGEKPFVCECGKAFSDMARLKVHKISVHEEKNSLYTEKYTCDVCERPFVNLGRLKRHKMVHSGEKPYSCEVCGRAFALEYNLNVHKKIHMVTKNEPT